MEYNVIATDLDGTLLTSNKKVTEKTKKVLTILKRKGFFILGITARNLSSVKGVVDINLFDYLILNNGSDIYDINRNTSRNINHINKDIIKKLTEQYEKISPRIEYCSINHYYLKTKTKDNSRNFLINIEKLKEIYEPISRINIFLETKTEQEQIKEEIEKNYQTIEIIKMNDTDQKNSRLWLTINPKGVNKLKTLKLLCKNLKTNTNKVVFFGDGENDLSIMKEVGLGVAMENSVPIIKQTAKERTLSNDEEGVAFFLEKYFLIADIK